MDVATEKSLSLLVHTSVHFKDSFSITLLDSRGLSPPRPPDIVTVNTDLAQLLASL